MDMETVSREELYRNLADLHRKIDIIMGSMPRFISRKKILSEIKESELEEAIKLGIIKPLRGRARNSPWLIERSEYERYLEYMKR